MTPATLLVVEDQAIIAADLHDQLLRQGYRVCGTAASGEEALALARRFRPELVLMDIRIQGEMDGIQTARILLEELDLPVIFLSAFSDELTLGRAKQATPHGFLVKPFDAHQLQLSIEMALNKHEHERELAVAREQMVRWNATLEQQVRERTEELQTALVEMEGVMRVVAHHLRSPLRVIEGYSQLMRTEYAEYLPETARHFPAAIVDNSQRLERLTDDLQAYIDLQHQPVFLEPVDILSAAGEVLDELLAARPEPPVQAHIEALPACQADQALLRRLLHELLANALKHTSERQPAVITVGAQPDTDRPGHAVYFVRDNGTGFDPAYAGQLFELFGRINLPEDYPGTGAGLAIARRIAERMGGRLWAESASGEGATFFLSLPNAAVESLPK